MTFCSFCGKAQNEVRKMIAGPAGVKCICDSCVSVCKTIIDRELSENVESAQPKGAASNERFNLLKPAQITAALDEHIISQITPSAPSQLQSIITTNVYDPSRV